MREIKLEPSWKLRLAQEFATDYMQCLSQFLRSEKAAGIKIYPPGGEIFHAFSLTPFDLVKVVILGQDPIMARASARAKLFCTPGYSQAAIAAKYFQRIASRPWLQPPPHGNLENWAKAGFASKQLSDCH